VGRRPDLTTKRANRERLDVLLVERGLAPSRERARALIMAAQVRVGGVVMDKPGSEVARDAAVELAADPVPFVGRGGLKLERALDVFPIDVRDRLCLDVGASTGGFTDCLLQRGARHVYAVDVGYGQLAYALRQDPRVTSLERVNARSLTESHVPSAVGFACVDVSFISVAKVLPAIVARLAPGADLVVLVKPQFEAGRRDVGKGGVVKDPAVHARVLREAASAASAAGLLVRGIVPSPIKGPAGNVEFLMWSRLETGAGVDVDDAIERALAECP